MLEFSIIVPVFNESGNIAPLYHAVNRAMGAIRWELIFVDDDSADGTTAEIMAIIALDPRVRTLRRVGRRGLSGACIEGILSCATEYFAVIDGDLQHDEGKLPEMLQHLRQGGCDLVVASRYMQGAGLSDWSVARKTVSRVATSLSRIVLRHRLTDPMSGFFAMRRAAFDAALPSLSKQGFKLLLDICASSPKNLQIAEVAYQFRSRAQGESKLDSIVALEYLLLVLNKLLGSAIPLRFFLFSAVGTIGLLLHLLILRLGLGSGLRFEVAQTVAVVAAMTLNFYLNNTLTYRDRRLRGTRLILGLMSFYMVCSIGVAANVGLASYVFYGGISWQLSAMAGVLVGTVWNFVGTAFLTWGRGADKT